MIYYRDGQALISTAMVVQALSPELPAQAGIGGACNGQCHPRYRCSDQEDSITRFALPPYLFVKGGPASMDHRP